MAYHPEFKESNVFLDINVFHYPAKVLFGLRSERRSGPSLKSDFFFLRLKNTD